jgi:hypothetical protein
MKNTRMLAHVFKLSLITDGETHIICVSRFSQYLNWSPDDKSAKIHQIVMLTLASIYFYNNLIICPKDIPLTG